MQVQGTGKFSVMGSHFSSCSKSQKLKHRLGLRPGDSQSAASLVEEDVALQVVSWAPPLYIVMFILYILYCLGGKQCMHETQVMVFYDSCFIL